MSINEELTHGHQGDTEPARATTQGVLSLALGLTAVMGGGTLANAFQWWWLDIARGGMDGGNAVQAMSALPPILLGIVAVALGLAAARSNDTLASATGKAGAVTGILALVGGVMLAVAILSLDQY